MKPESSTASHSQRKFLVLLVEDDPVNRKVIRKQLERLSCQVIEAANGLLGLEQWNTLRKNGLPDFIVTDCQMPEMDGYQLARTIRQTEENEELVPVPLLGMTATHFYEEQEKCLSVGMDSYLVKPVTNEKLASFLTEQIEKRNRMMRQTG